MKICQISAVDFTMAHFLLPLMRALQSRGHEVVAVCRDGEHTEAIRNEGFRLEAVGFDRSFNVVRHVQAYRTLVDLFEREHFDVVHVHTPIAALVGRLAAARTCVPHIVYTAHGFYFHEHQHFSVRWLAIALEWLAGRYTDVLFTQAQEDCDTAKRLHLCRTGQIAAIGNGVDPAKFYPVGSEMGERQATREAFGASDEDVVVVTVGRLVKEKGYFELFEAIRDTNLHLWVVGSRLKSDHATAIDDQIETIRNHPLLSQRIKFLGYRDDVVSIIQAADIFTLASHREGMPRSIIEAMMVGLPIVATNIRGCREEIIDGETGILVPVRDPETLSSALLKLAEDSTLRSEMGYEGRKRALEYYNEDSVIANQIPLIEMSS